jgi:glycosyltransferase involved in cell wall biosynthesis
MGRIDPEAAEVVAADWGFLGSRIVVVSPFPPKPDGIGRYTEQLLSALAGRSVRRLGVPGGGGDVVVEVSGGLRPLRILRHVRGASDVLVMYHPTYFHHFANHDRLLSTLALWIVSRAAPVTFVVHEPDDPCPAEIGRRGKVEFWLLERLRRRMWSRVRRVIFHTEWEQRRFDARFPGTSRRAERLVDHGAFFVAEVQATPEQARAALGLPASGAILLMIGFLSPHKRYDSVIEAFATAGLQGAQLHIVGSPITDWPEVMAHVELLRSAAARVPHVHLHEGFLDDAAFDLWIRAADAVVVPYGSASSSGVVPRVHLLGGTVVSSAAGGIADQLAPGDLRYADDAGLVAALRTIADRRALTGT